MAVKLGGSGPVTGAVEHHGWLEFDEARLRLSDADKARLVAAAERERLDFSSWARRVLLREADAVLGTTT